MSIRNNRMTPEELRKSIDPEWPADARFLIEKAADSWQSFRDKTVNYHIDCVKDREKVIYALICYIRILAKKMNSGWLVRLLAKGWRSTLTEMEKDCESIEVGFIYPEEVGITYNSAEKTKDEKYEERQTKEDEGDLQKRKA